MNKDKDSVDRINNFSKLSREANIAMSDVLWAIDSRNDFIGNLTDRMREHAEDMLLPKLISTEINFKIEDPNQKLSLEYRQNLFLLFKEAVNNIVKHSNAKNVVINYHQSNAQSILLIKNDGVENTKSEIVTGQGLKNIQMRAKAINGSATIINKLGSFEINVLLKV